MDPYWPAPPVPGQPPPLSQYLPGQVGQAFAGAQVSRTHNQSLLAPEVITVAGWFQMVDIPHADREVELVIAAKDNRREWWSRQYTMYIKQYVTGDDWRWQLQADIWVDTTNGLRQVSVIADDSDECHHSRMMDVNWHHVGITWDYETLSLYKDGVRIGYYSDVPGGVYGPLHYVWSTTPQFSLGVDPSIPGSPAGWLMEGVFDDFAVWTGAMTPDQMLLLYRAGLANHGTCRCEHAPSGLVVWFRAEGNGDDQFSGNPAQSVNGAGFASGFVGSSFTVSSANQQIFSVEDEPALNQTTALTVEAWVKVATSPANDIVSILVKEDPYGNNWSTHQYQLALRRVGSQLFLRPVIQVPTGIQGVDGATPIQVGTWYHVAMTYDGSALKLYVNGRVDSKLSLTGPITTSTQPLNIGGLRAGPWNFDGNIDELSIYSRALTETEIQGIYNVGTQGKCDGLMPPW